MREAQRKYCDERGWLLIPLFGFLASISWVAWKVSILPPREWSVAAHAEKLAANAPPSLPRKSSHPWNSPTAQTRGKEWIFDLFTPPEIFFDDVSKHFSVTPPTTEIAAALPVESDFGVELIGLERSPFPLQLVGFIGEGSSAFGTFEDVATTEHILARAGHRLPALKLTITDFSLEKVSLSADGESAPASEWLATAKVRDDLSGKETVLSSRERNFSGPWLARIQFSGGADHEIQTVHEGELVRSDEFSFCLKEIRAEANCAVVTRTPLDAGDPELRTLVAARPIQRTTDSL